MLPRDIFLVSLTAFACTASAFSPSPLSIPKSGVPCLNKQGGGSFCAVPPTNYARLPPLYAGKKGGEKPGGNRPVGFDQVSAFFLYCIFFTTSLNISLIMLQRSGSQSPRDIGSSMDAAKAAAKAAESFQLDDNFLKDDSDAEIAPVAAMSKEDTRKQKQFDASSDRMQR